MKTVREEAGGIVVSEELPALALPGGGTVPQARVWSFVDREAFNKQAGELNAAERAALAPALRARLGL